MLKVATINHNEQKTRIGIYFSKGSLYFKENNQYKVIEDSEGWTTMENYAHVCRCIWGNSSAWNLRFEEIQY